MSYQTGRISTTLRLNVSVSTTVSLTYHLRQETSIPYLCFTDLWLMPLPNLHMTALEITHSLTAPEIHSLVDRMRPIIPTMCNYLLDHHAPLTKPLLSYDSSALALSFLPDERQSYTYHHLRRDLYNVATGDYTDPKVKIESRYVVPSAHITREYYLSFDLAAHTGLCIVLTYSLVSCPIHQSG